MSDPNVPAVPPPASGPVPQPTGHLGASTASLRREIRMLRVLLYACLALIVVLMIGVGMGLSATHAQIGDLQAQVVAAAAPAGTPAAPTATTSPAPAATPAPTGVAQLGAAAALQGVDLPDGADPTGAILIGDPNAGTVIETYIDFQCPYCQQWEKSYGTALIDRALKPGSDLLVKQYNLAFLGETSAALDPAGASARAASAAACVVDHDGAEAFATFSRSLFATADPTEPPGQFTAADLTGLAKKAGASDATLSCIKDETYVPFVAATTQAGFARGVTGTPTVVIDGVTLGNAFSDATLSQLMSTV